MATINTAWDQVSSNIFKTWLIMFFFAIFATGVIFVIVRAWLGPNIDALSIIGMSLIVAGVMNFFSYWFSDKIVLGVSRAQPVDEKSNKGLYRLVENLCIAAGLPAPKIYVIEDTATNAFATGRDPKHAAICFTSGILEKLNKQELEGVTAHELSHVGNRDTLLMGVVSVLVGMIALLSDWYLRSMWYRGRDEEDNKSGAIMIAIALIAAILAPIVATLIQLAVSRRRELLADASGVLLTRYPQGLENALLKISADKEPLEAANRGTAHLYIVNPLKGKDVAGFMANLFNTHPSIEVRIKALKEMEGKV